MGKKDQPKDIKFPQRKNAVKGGWFYKPKSETPAKPTKRPADSESGWALGRRWLD